MIITYLPGKFATIHINPEGKGVVLNAQNGNSLITTALSTRQKLSALHAKH